MKRVVLAAAVLVALIAAVLLLRREPNAPSSQVEIAGTEFASDSLGVAFSIPPGRGWSLQRDPPIPGGSYVSASREDDLASFKLFVTPADQARSLSDIERRRRDQFASLFGVSDLAVVIDHVLQEDRSEELGFPVLRWQAVTTAVDVAGEAPARVMFMWMATLRESFAYEAVGLLRFPAEPTPEQGAVTDGLLADLASMLQSIRLR